MDTQALCGLKAADFQKEIGGKKTDLYILRNANGCEVAITNYGGALVAIMVPDRKGEYANVIQGHDNIDSCVNSPEPFLSTLVGRYGNRIAKGKFQLNGKRVSPRGEQRTESPPRRTHRFPCARLGCRTNRQSYPRTPATYQPTTKKASPANSP